MIGQAFLFADRLHAGQRRKDGRAYIVHPVEVAFELSKNGADDALICAGLLHDVIEDAGVTETELEQIFPPEVVRLVVMDSEDKSKSWEERKESTLNLLNSTDDIAFRMLICADKLVNLRSIETEMSEIGDDIWKQFKRGKEQQAWLYNSIVDALAPLCEMPMYRELKETVGRIFDTERGI